MRSTPIEIPTHGVGLFVLNVPTKLSYRPPDAIEPKRFPCDPFLMNSSRNQLNSH